MSCRVCSATGVRCGRASCRASCSSVAQLRKHPFLRVFYSKVYHVCLDHAGNLDELEWTARGVVCSDPLRLLLHGGVADRSVAVDGSVAGDEGVAVDRGVVCLGQTQVKNL